MNGTVETRSSWLRVREWSPVLPAVVLAGLRTGAGPVAPPDARQPARPTHRARPRAGHGEHRLNVEDLAELAKACGPTAADHALAQAEDAGWGGYAMVLHRLIAADPPSRRLPGRHHHRRRHRGAHTAPRPRPPGQSAAAGPGRPAALRRLGPVRPDHHHMARRHRPGAGILARLHALAAELAPPAATVEADDD